MPKLILPDIEIASVALRWWPEPKDGYYQAKIMTTIPLMETNGDAYGPSLMNVPPSIFAGYEDRGLYGINEGALFEILGYWVDPATFADPMESGHYARIMWDWRYRDWIRRGYGVTAALIHAYEGWTTYRKKATDPQYKLAWAQRWPRADAAVREVTS